MELFEAPFFVLRTPLLPTDAFVRWGAGLQSAGAISASDAEMGRCLDHDRTLLRERLAAVAAGSDVTAALEVSSSELAAAVGQWRDDQANRKHRSTERSLVRYLTRCASRPDLSGLTGAYSLGGFEGLTSLTVDASEGLEIRARIDPGLLQKVVRRATDAAAATGALVIRANPNVYPAGGRLRVAARTADGNRHRLVAFRPSPEMHSALAMTRGGISISSLVAKLAADGVEPQRAMALVTRLVALDFLIPMTQITITGDEPTAQALAALAELPGAEAECEAVATAERAIRGAERVGRAAIEEVAAAIESVGVTVNRRFCVQVDSSRPRRLCLSRRVRTEMCRVATLLARVAPPPHDSLREFRERFERRFATRSVPLLEALDPDFGVRLSDTPSFPPAGETQFARRAALLGLLERGRRSGAVELTDNDIAALSTEAAPSLPDAFVVGAGLLARDEAAIDTGRFQLVEPFVDGPSGARMLGRFCHGDTSLEGLVRDHLRREEALRPDVIFAELTASAETDWGLNVTHRPLLRQWEIEYGGASGAPATSVLDPSDLLVSVHGREVLLHSARLGCQVVPSCTTAINFDWVSLPGVRLLHAIAQQGTVRPCWSWDQLSDLPELPRVTHGHSILALRRWNIGAAELAGIDAGTDSAGFRRLQRWRTERGLPRIVSVDHPKHPLVVDFDNVLSVEVFLADAKARPSVGLRERPDVGSDVESAVRGPAGTYANVVQLPCVRRQAPVRRPRRALPASVTEAQRRFAPGSEWLFANLYVPSALTDCMLTEVVAPLVSRARAEQWIDRWFFIRYDDHGRQLRVRFHGAPQRLWGELLPALRDAVAPALDDGRLYRLSLDTYEREVERYGGLSGVELMERTAEADSDAVITILSGGSRISERRHLAVASVASLYAGSTLDLTAQHRCCRVLSEPSTRGFNVPRARLLRDTARSERSDVNALLAMLESEEPALDAAIDALRVRARRLAPALHRLRALADEGVLERSHEEILGCHAHMFVNRILREGGGVDELRVHDALAGVYEARLARERRQRAQGRTGASSSNSGMAARSGQ